MDQEFEDENEMMKVGKVLETWRTLKVGQESRGHRQLTADNPNPHPSLVIVSPSPQTGMSLDYKATSRQESSALFIVLYTPG